MQSFSYNSQIKGFLAHVVMDSFLVLAYGNIAQICLPFPVTSRIHDTVIDRPISIQDYSNRNCFAYILQKRNKIKQHKFRSRK
jgi:hypothetical protein